MRNQDGVWTCWEAIRSDNWASWRRIYVFYGIAHLLCGISSHTYIYSRCINTPQPDIWCVDLPSRLPAGVRTCHGHRSAITSTTNQYETMTCWMEPLTIINKDASSHFVFIVFRLSRAAVLLVIWVRVKATKRKCHLVQREYLVATLTMEALVVFSNPHNHHGVSQGVRVRVRGEMSPNGNIMEDGGGQERHVFILLVWSRRLSSAICLETMTLTTRF